MKILVIGDIIRDHYVYGTMERLNPEGAAPLVRCIREETKLGGASNVWANLISLGVDADMLDYDECYQSIKTRVLCDGHYVTRIDHENKVDGEIILDKLKSYDLSVYDYVLLSDYDKGALDNVEAIIEFINESSVKIIVDPKRDLKRFNGAWLIKANDLEAKTYGLDEWTGDYIHTRAGDSIEVRHNGHKFKVYPEYVEVADVTGAGDCFMAALVYSLGLKRNLKTSVEVAARGATKSVQHLNTYVLKREDLDATVVFTNGCFDILHRGHIEYLQQSKRLGSKLIVGLNSDESVKRLKGSSRPIHNENDRKMALESLRCVDQVMIFDADTPYELIRYINPDIITKGGDYRPEDVVGNDLAKVVILPFVENYSTTNIVSKLND